MAKEPSLMEEVGTTLNQAPDPIPIRRTLPHRVLFENRLTAALEGNGFRIVETSNPEAHLVLPRAEGRAEHPKHNLFSSINGRLTGIPFDAPNDLTIVHANMNVVVAEAI